MTIRQMKCLKLTLVTSCVLFLLSSAAFGFSTHTTVISRTFDPVEAEVFVGEDITVTVNFTTSEVDDLRGFYYTDQIPQGLTVDTVSVKINGTDIPDYIFENDSLGDVYDGCIPYRWILETPTAFLENNPIPPNYTVEIVYSVSSTDDGTFDFDEFDWVGYYQNATEGYREAFGHSEDADKQTITFMNAPPVANDDTATTTEETPVTINVVANDTDADGEIVPDTVLIVNAPVYGSVFDHGDGTVTYTPDADTNGIHTFGYTVADDDGARSNEATVTVTVTAVNDAPVADDQSVATDEDTPATITMTASDVDVDDTLTFAVVTTPEHGTLSGTAPNLTYTPNPDYNGPDSFTFKANDGTVDSNIATVSITVNSVNDAPVAADDTASTNEDTAVVIDVLANDTDADTGDTLTVQSVTNPANGTVADNGDGTVTYTPAANFHGTDTFTYTVSDGNGGTDTATVSITVNPVNDAPVAVDDTASTNEDTAVVIDVLANDTDADTGDTLTVQSATDPANGTVVNNGGTVTYAPDANYNGTDTFTYTVSDGNGGTDTATVTITVTPVNDAPVANDQSVSTDEDTAVAITLTGSDVEGDPLDFSVVTGPSNGTLSGTAPSLTYTPDADYNGSDSFTFKANDGSLDSNIATVSITVNSVNDAPVAADDTASTYEGEAVVIGVLGNDTDPDTGDTLTVQSVTDPNNGSVVINGDGTVTYTPAVDFIGTDTFTYTVQDDDGATSNEAAVTVTVNEIVERLDLDLKIKELKDGTASEEDVKTMIERYMERP